MEVAKIWEDLQELPQLVIKIGKKDSEAISKLDKLSRIIYGKPVAAGCSNCHTQAYIKLTSLTYEKLTEMAERKFKLKKGITIEYPVRSGNFFNQETLTDDQAEKYLAAVPSGSKHFEVIPDKESDEKPLDKMNKEELQAVYKKEFGEDPAENLTKADLIKEINK